MWARQPAPQGGVLRGGDGRHVVAARPHRLLPGLVLVLGVAGLVRAQRLRLPQRQHRRAQTAAQDSQRLRPPAAPRLPLWPIPSGAERTLGFGVHPRDDADDPVRTASGVPVLCGKQYDHHGSLPQS